MNDFGVVAASKMLVEERKKVRLMFRVDPIDNTDSGWRFFCGDETEDYLKDLRNIEWCDIEDILAIDKSIRKYLAEDIDTILVRKDENKDFKFIRRSMLSLPKMFLLYITIAIAIVCFVPLILQTLGMFSTETLFSDFISRLQSGVQVVGMAIIPVCIVGLFIVGIFIIFGVPKKRRKRFGSKIKDYREAGNNVDHEILNLTTEEE